MTTVGSVNFCGTPINQSTQSNYSNPQITSTNFKAKKVEADTYNGKTKKSHPVRKLLTLAVVAAGAIVGLGYAKNANWVKNIKNEKLKKCTETVTGKCHDWSAAAKDLGIKGWNKVRNIFSKK